jgi:hypothetical protein
MADRPKLSVVGGTTVPEPDDTERAEAIAAVAERMVRADAYWVMTDVDGEIMVAYDGGRLEAAALACEVARDMVRDSLGMNL